MDIQIKNGRVLLVSEPFTTQKIEEQVKKMTYHGKGVERDLWVENARLPSFVETFYSTVFALGRLPEDEEFVQCYLKAHFVPVDEESYKFKDESRGRQVFSRAGLRGRALRAYPSLVRDFHFVLLCQESDLFEAVTYSMNSDYFDGIDLFVKYKGKVYAVDLYANTNAAKRMREVKKDRHKPSPWPRIAVKRNISGTNTQIFLYGEEDVRRIVEEIKQKIGWVGGV